jgi:hypothetical protein
LYIEAVDGKQLIPQVNLTVDCSSTSGHDAVVDHIKSESEYPRCCVAWNRVIRYVAGTRFLTLRLRVYDLESCRLAWRFRVWGLGFGISPLDVDCVAVLARFEEEPDSGHDLPMTQKQSG